MESQYLNYFGEIKTKSKAEQLEILSKARYEAFVVQRLNLTAIRYLVLIALLVVVLISAIQVYFEPGLLIGGLTNATIVLVGILLHRYLCGKLLYIGLKRVLSAEHS